MSASRHLFVETASLFRVNPGFPLSMSYMSLLGLSYGYRLHYWQGYGTHSKFFWYSEELHVCCFQFDRRKWNVAFGTKKSL